MRAAPPGRGEDLRQCQPAHTTVSGNLPISVSLIVSKDVHVPVIGIDLEPALRRSKPAINDSTHFEPTSTQPERMRLLLTSVTSVTLDTNCHSANDTAAQIEL